MKIADDFSFIEKANYEKEALGFNVTYHPHIAYKDLIKTLNLMPLSKLNEMHEIDALASIKNIKVIKTKQGREMAFITVDDGFTEIECTLFNYEKFKDQIGKDIYIVKIKKDSYRQKISFVIESVKSLKEKSS
jgi:DNA polymerase-3 subunit alpha